MMDDTYNIPVWVAGRNCLRLAETEIKGLKSTLKGFK